MTSFKTSTVRALGRGLVWWIAASALSYESGQAYALMRHLLRELARRHPSADPLTTCALNQAAPAAPVPIRTIRSSLSIAR